MHRNLPACVSVVRKTRRAIFIRRRRSTAVKVKSRSRRDEDSDGDKRKERVVGGGRAVASGATYLFWGVLAGKIRREL